MPWDSSQAISQPALTKSYPKSELIRWALAMRWYLQNRRRHPLYPTEKSVREDAAGRA